MTKRKLTEEEKAANVAAGLTPTGRIPKRSKDDPGATEAPSYEPGDYRVLHTNFTDHRKNHFIRILKETGEPALAAADVGVALRTAQRHRGSDELFRDAWDEALRQHAAIYAMEMKRRGVDGWDEPVFGSQGAGAGVGIVGWVKKYSDRLLIEQARKHDPEGYTPRSKVEATTTVETKGLSLDQLSPESRADLRRIIERELEAQAEQEDPEVS